MCQLNNWCSALFVNEFSSQFADKNNLFWETKCEQELARIDWIHLIYIRHLPESHYRNAYKLLRGPPSDLLMKIGFSLIKISTNYKPRWRSYFKMILISLPLQPALSSWKNHCWVSIFLNVMCKGEKGFDGLLCTEICCKFKLDVFLPFTTRRSFKAIYIVMKRFLASSFDTRRFLHFLQDFRGWT